MDPDSMSIPFVLFALLLMSSFFSASETALVALTPAKVETLLLQKARSAKWISYLKNNPQKMFLIILIYNNLVNIGASVLATLYFTSIYGAAGAAIAAGTVTVGILLFGEILPKSLANKYSLAISKKIAYPLVLFGYLIYPVIWILDKFLTKVIGDTLHTVSEDEVMAMVSMGAKEGSLEKHEQEFIENVLEFNDMTAEDILTHRTNIFALPTTTSIKDAVAQAIESGHSRIPVYTDSIDDIIGFVTVKKLLATVLNPKMLEKTLADLDLYEFIKVPASKKVYSLFSDFKKKRTHIALVYDEHGGIEGIATMEDVLEEIVGEIIDETDANEKESITKKDKDTLLLEADAEIGDIEKALDIKIPNYDSFNQISWVILEHLSRFPKLNEEIVIGQALFKVIKMDATSNRILEVQAKKHIPSPSEDSELDS